MVDYSKWSSFQESDDSSDGSTESPVGRPPTLLAAAADNGRGETAAQAGLIFLHGSGDTGPGVKRWLSAATGGAFERMLVGMGVLAEYPTAPMSRHLLTGEQMNIWFNRRELSYEALLDPAEVASSLAIVQNQLDSFEEKGVPRKNIVVGGFSMGGGLALQYLEHPDRASALAGIFCLSSFLARRSPVYSAAPTSTPIFMAHGAVDALIPVEWGRQTAEELKTKGYDVQYEEYEQLDHSLGAVELKALLKWMEAALARARERSNDSPPGPGTAQQPSGAIAPVEFTVKAHGDVATVTFSVPPGTEHTLTAAPLAANGAHFELVAGDTPGHVQARFISPKPELTAKALASRISQRLQDSDPPGAEQCSLC